MSRIRKTSDFQPPPVFQSNDKAPVSHSSRECGSSQDNDGKSLRRRFSHDEALVPIQANASAEDFAFVETLFTSTMSDVVKVKRKDTKEIIVVKAFSRFSWRSEYLCHAELRVLERVNSPWIIGYLGYLQDFREDFLLFEYLPHGSLLELIHKSTLSEAQVKFYAAEMFMAVDSLHQYGIMHRNIQLSNFLLHNSGHLRIIGFGLSYMFKDDSDSKQDCSKSAPEKKSSITNIKAKKPKLYRITNPVFASPDKTIPLNAKKKRDDGCSQVLECSTSYMAPEVLRLVMPKHHFQLLKRYNGYSYLCDYWSLGVALYRMLYGSYPFTSDTRGLIVDKVLNFRKTLTFPMTVSLESMRFVVDLLKKESNRLGRRHGMREIREHHFFMEICWDRLGHGKVHVPVRNSELDRYMSSCAEAKSVSRKEGISESQTSLSSVSEESSIREDYDRLNELSFAIPMCSDPSVSIQERSSHGKSEESSEKALTVQGSTTLGSRSRNMPDHQDTHEAEKTYLQTLMKWFFSSTDSVSSDPKSPLGSEDEKAPETE